MRTAADQAELDVLVHALTTGYAQHRQKCDACQPCDELNAWRAHKAECAACTGDAPLTHGAHCERREVWLQHNRAGCARCLPCERVQRAVAEVCHWREARVLLSRAEALRAQLEDRAA